MFCHASTGFGYSMTLGLGLPTLKEKKGKAIEEAEGLHFGLLSSRDANSLIGFLG
jgi:hypothetical protein